MEELEGTEETPLKVATVTVPEAELQQLVQVTRGHREAREEMENDIRAVVKPLMELFGMFQGKGTIEIVTAMTKAAVSKGENPISQKIEPIALFIRKYQEKLFTLPPEHETNGTH